MTGETIDSGAHAAKGSLVPALLVALLAFAGGAAAFYAPPRVGEMAVVFPFGTSEAAGYRIILSAGGRFVASSHLPNIAIAYATDPGFAGRVQRAGALLTLAARGLCGPDLTVKELA